jgi:hypothetical protein
MLANRWPTCWASVRRERFELARIPPSGNEADGEVAGGGGERYRLSRCKRPLAAAVMARLGVPLPASERTVLLDDLAWGEIEVGGCVAGVSWCVWRRPECVLLLCRCGGPLPNRAWGELSWMAAMHINTH